MPPTDPFSNDLIETRVKKVAWKNALLETLDCKFKFSIPLALLPKSLEIGKQLNLKILGMANTEEVCDDLARKLLEEIIN